MSLARARELRADRARLTEEARKIQKGADEAGLDRLSSEDETRFDGLMGEVDSLKETIDALEGREAKLKTHEEEIAEKRELYVDLTKLGHGDEIKNVEEQEQRYSDVFRKYVRYGRAELSREDRQVLEQRALAKQVIGTDSSGGFTVPDDMQSTVVSALKAFGGMREVATTLNTSNGRNLDVPVSDDTGNVAKLVGEATAITASTKVPFGTVQLEAHLYHTGPIKLSHELVQDSVIDIDGFVAEAMQTRLGRIWNTHFTTRSSTESAGPNGIVNDSTGAVDVVSLATLTVDNLMDLQDSVDHAHWPNATWMFNNTVFTALRKLRRGSSDQFLWAPGLTQGAPDLLLGHGYTINQDVESFGTSGNKPVWFGDFSHYWIRDVVGLSIRRLEERFAEEGVVALLGYARVDGRAVFGSTVPSLEPYRAIIQAT